MYATRTIFNPIMGVIGTQFNLSNTQLGLANSIFFLTYAVAQIPFGIVGDKIGRKLVIAVGFLLLALTTYFTGLATSFVMFLVIRALAGSGQGAYYGPQYALSTEAIPDNKRTIGNAIIVLSESTIMLNELQKAALLLIQRCPLTKQAQPRGFFMEITVWDIMCATKH